jgi:hypothetical protein
MESARQWYEARSGAAAEAFLYELNDAIQQILEAPDRWPRDWGTARRFVLRRFPFNLVYRQTASSIRFIALAHHKRRPGYWRSR